MPGLVTVVVAMLLIGVMTSNKEGRAKARAWLKSYERGALIASATIIAVIAASYFYG